MVYARTLEGKPYDFGMKGVERGTLLMYDKQTNSRWSQLFGEAIEGEMKGKALEKLPSTMTTWKQWRQLHPDTTVYVKRSEPYEPDFTSDYFARITQSEEGPVRGEDLIIGVEGLVEARAYLARRLARDGRLQEDELEGKPILIYLSDDLTTARVYQRKIGDRTLTFELADDERLRDRETGSAWNPMTGTAVSGPMQGEELNPVITTYSLWFAWKRYRPDTVIHGEPPPPAAGTR